MGTTYERAPILPGYKNDGEPTTGIPAKTETTQPRPESTTKKNIVGSDKNVQNNKNAAANTSKSK